MSRTGGALRRVAGLATLLGLSACPEPPPPPGPCSNGAEPLLTLADRGRGADEFARGDMVEIFNAPQGGVFSELDVTIDALDLEDLLYLRVTVDPVAGGEQLAFTRYFGNSVPLRCSDETDVLEMDHMPLGYSSAFLLDELDGQSVVMVGTLETMRGEWSVEYELTLKAVQY